MRSSHVRSNLCDHEVCIAGEKFHAKDPELRADVVQLVYDSPNGRVFLKPVSHHMQLVEESCVRPK